MLAIPCPWCGSRAEVEFRCGGEADPVSPGLESTDGDWADYLFFRANVKGAHRERWVHAYGCGQWFILERDTASHAILGSAPLAGGRRE